MKLLRGPGGRRRVPRRKPYRPPCPPPSPANQITADQYYEHWKAREVWTHLERPKHRKRLNWCADQCVGETFADVGCMLGHSTAIMAARRPGLWTGIDFTAEAVAQAECLFTEGIVFKFCEQPEDLNVLGAFDSVVCSEVIEHVGDDAGFLRALAGIARRRIVLTTPCVDAQDPGHVRIYTRETLDALLAGYEATITKDDAFFYVTVEVAR